MYSPESEAAVLGSLMIENDLIDDLDLRVEDFANTSNQTIYEAMVSMNSESQPFDAFAISDYLGKKTQEIGGLNYITNMARVATPQVASAYAQIVKNSARKRKLARIGTEIVERAHSDEKAVDIIDFAQSEVLTLDEDKESGAVSITEMMPAFLDALEERFNNGGEICGLPSGFAELDKRTLGFNNGELIIVAGRPSMGKTTLATNIARNVALDGGTTLIFSLEMPKEQLLNREYAAVGGVSLQAIRSGQLEDADFTKVANATSAFNGKKFFVDDHGGLNVNDIRSRSRRIKKQHGLDLIVVDYIQLISGKGESRTVEVEMISRGLKNIAKELDVPVIALSQLNRELEKRPNKRPLMSDLRQSGALEQDADLILFVYRDEVYDQDSIDKGIAEINIAKQRNGELGYAKLSFQGEFCRFADLTWGRDYAN